MDGPNRGAADQAAKLSETLVFGRTIAWHFRVFERSVFIVAAIATLAALLPAFMAINNWNKEADDRARERLIQEISLENDALKVLEDVTSEDRRPSVPRLQTAIHTLQRLGQPINIKSPEGVVDLNGIVLDGIREIKITGKSVSLSNCVISRTTVTIHAVLVNINECDVSLATINARPFTYENEPEGYSLSKMVHTYIHGGRIDNVALIAGGEFTITGGSTLSRLFARTNHWHFAGDTIQYYLDYETSPGYIQTKHGLRKDLMYSFVNPPAAQRVDRYYEAWMRCYASSPAPECGGRQWEHYTLVQKGSPGGSTTTSGGNSGPDWSQTCDEVTIAKLLKRDPGMHALSDAFVGVSKYQDTKICSDRKRR